MARTYNDYTPIAAWTLSANAALTLLRKRYPRLGEATFIFAPANQNNEDYKIVAFRSIVKIMNETHKANAQFAAMDWWLVPHDILIDTVMRQLYERLLQSFIGIPETK